MKIIKNNKKLIYIYALIFVLYLSVITMAKYTGKVSTSNSASIAKWYVSLDGASETTLDQITIGDASTYRDYKLYVTSLSETAIDYKMVISNVPSDLIVKIDGVEYSPNNNNSITISHLGSFTANDNDSTHEHSMKFIVPIGADEIINQKLNLDVIFTQKSI